MSHNELRSFGGAIETRAARQAKDDPISLGYLRTYHWMRTVVGLLGVALPIILIGGVGILDDVELSELHSLSAFYHTGMRDFFVSILVATGILLTTYRISEWNWDNWLSWAAGAFLIVVAFIPTGIPKGISAQPTPIQGFFGADETQTIHLWCAGASVAFSGVICLIFAYREWKKPRNLIGGHTPRLSQKSWAVFHLAMAILIGGAIGFIAATNFIDSWNTYWWDENGLLVGEIVVTAAFGASWLAKGLDINVLFSKPTE
jgi:uncharacterized membrane protein YidH (DUF202 family)